MSYVMDPGRHSDHHSPAANGSHPRAERYCDEARIQEGQKRQSLRGKKSCPKRHFFWIGPFLSLPASSSSSVLDSPFDNAKLIHYFLSSVRHYASPLSFLHRCAEQTPRCSSLFTAIPVAWMLNSINAVPHSIRVGLLYTYLCAQPTKSVERTQPRDARPPHSETQGNPVFPISLT
jgi:hypothetical protein